MSVIEKKLHQRSNSTCELCTSPDNLTVYHVPPVSDKGPELEKSILICGTCASQIENPDTADSNHWRCLNDSMWSEEPAVQVIAWRMLHRLKSHGWSQDLLDMMYLDEERLEWANALGDGDEPDENAIVHKDCNGNILKDGDSVVLIKDLVVKGANFTAKRGAAVHRISLVWDNENQIEGRVDGQHIVILTQYVKKTKEDSRN
ncbi:PhnA domain-containing protein [Pseudofulvibacter geojedonensis]|uniref:PhnA domain-containing protein n=1 Tax=Pseudofulvibacter geojedonensis TaxID=1123758 RepID=A0ABW3I6C7_9FLAO